MARAPDPRIEKAKAMYFEGRKLVEIAKTLDLPEGTVRRWKSTLRKGALPSRGTRTAPASRQEIRKQKNMDSSPSISRTKPGRFFLPLSRRPRWIFYGIRSKLLMLPSFGRSESPM